LRALKRLFRPVAAHPAETQFGLSEQELQEEYRAQLTGILLKAGIDDACVSIDIRPMGESGGMPLFWCFLRIVKWQPASGVRLLLGLPHIERAFRRHLAGSWIADASHFGGIWLHPSTAVLESSAMRELGVILSSLGTPDSGPLSDPMWSLPGELK
jgi:hypothetical protein